MTHQAAATALLCAALALSGCSGGSDSADERAATSSSSSASTSASPSATVSESPTETAAPEVLDPCDMVPEQTWHRLLPRERVAHATLTRKFVTQAGILLSSDRTRYVCQVGFDDSADAPVTWGYFPGTFVGEDLEKLLKSSGGTPVSELGFVAYTTGDIVSSDAFGIVGSTGVLVSVNEKVDSVLHSDERTQDKQLVAILRSLGKNVDASVVQAKRAVPELCPDPAADEVPAVYGKVEVARGGDDGAGRWWCIYRQAGGDSELRLDAYRLTDDYFNSFYASTRKNPNEVDMFDGPPDMIRMVSVGDDGGGDTIVLDPATQLYVDVSLSYRDRLRRDLDRTAFVALARTFFDSVATTVDAD